jgi:hypothetical protein
MIDDDGVQRLLAVNEQPFELCNWVNERGDLETAARLIPILDELTRILAKAIETQ